MPSEESLPARTETEPDAKGVKTVIEWKFNEAGEKVKVTKKVRMVKKTTRTSKRVADRRRHWPKFGAARDAPPGPEPNITIVALDQVYIEHPNEDQLKKDNIDTPGGGSIVSCRSCGMTGDHWTRDCPYGDGKKPEDRPPAENDDMSLGGGLASGSSGKYVPPGMRNRLAGGAEGAAGGAGESDGRRQYDDSATLRVTNLSDDTTEGDLQALFRPFGHVARVYLARDRVTQASRNFAFVSFVRRDEAEVAMNKLNGHGYDHLILKLEWAKPSAPKTGGDGNGRAPEDPSAKYRTGYGKALPQGLGNKK